MPQESVQSLLVMRVQMKLFRVNQDRDPDNIR